MQNQIYPLLTQPVVLTQSTSIASAPPFPVNQQPLNSSYYNPPPQIIINNTGNTHINTQKNNDWSSGLCNCFGDVGECCFALFCPICYQIKLFNDADECCCSWCFGGLVPLRTKIRTKNHIQGSICEDYCVLLWCGFCATVQMGIEIKNTKYNA